MFFEQNFCKWLSSLLNSCSMESPLGRVFPLLLLASFLSSCALLPRNEFRPVEKGENWRVRLTKFVSGSDIVSKGGFDHPHTFTLVRLNRILGAVYYKDNDVLGKSRKSQVFNKRVRKKLLRPIQKAFSMAQPDEVVDFSFMLKKQVLFFFSNDFFTSGIMFIKDGRLNIVFRTINFKGANYSEAIRQFVGDPTNRPIVNSWRLVTEQGQSLKKAARKSFSFFGQPYYTNWLIVDLNYDFKPPPLKRRHKRLRRQPIQELTPRGEAPRIRFERPFSNVGAVYYGRSVKDSVKAREVRKKIEVLRDLYNRGEISRSTYERKKEELLAP